MKKYFLTTLLVSISFGLIAQTNTVSFNFQELASDSSLSEFPTDLKVVDLDGDMDEDIIGVSNRSNALIWFENNGDDSYTRRTIEISTTATNDILEVQVGDLDMDGDLDLISFSDDESIFWFENDGSENFSSTLIFQDEDVIDIIQSFDIADMDMDGDLDLVVSGDKLVLFRNDDLVFTPVLVEVNPSSCIYGDIDLVDVNNDSQVDIFTAYFGNCRQTESKVLLLINNDGQFERQVISDSTIGTNTGGWKSLNHADLNGDGRIDLIASQTFEQVAWFAQKSDGTFTRDTVFVTTFGGQNWDVSILDFNNDMKLDVSFVRTNDGAILLMENDGNGDFTEFTRIESEDLSFPRSAKPILNASGDFDFAVANSNNNNYVLAKNDGASNFVLSELLQRVSIYNNLIDMLLVDVNNDNNLDIVSATQTHVVYNLREESGAFGERIVIEQDSLFSIESIFIADLDNNGTSEIILSGLSVPDFEEAILWIKEDLSQELITFPELASPSGNVCGLLLCKSMVRAFDMNNDGYDDLLFAANVLDKVIYLENNQDGSFTEIIVESDAENATFVAGMDVDEDGNNDIVTSFESGSFDVQLGIYLGNGQGEFTKNEIPVNSSSVWDIQKADLDGNGNDELVFANNGRGIKTWSRNFSSGIESLPVNDTIGGSSLAYRFDIADLDKDGDLDLIAALPNDDSFGWYENRGDEYFFHKIGVEPLKVDFPVAVFTLDVNGNDTLDIIGGNYLTDNIILFESVIEEIPLLNIFEDQFDLTVYPNPVEHGLKISLFEDRSLAYRILTLSGQSLKSGIIDRSSTIDVTDLAPNLYFLELKLNGQSIVYRFIKR